MSVPFFSNQKTNVQPEYQLKHNFYRALKVCYRLLQKKWDFYPGRHAWVLVPTCRWRLSELIPGSKDPHQPHELSQKHIQSNLHHAQDKQLKQI